MAKCSDCAKAKIKFDKKVLCAHLDKIVPYATECDFHISKKEVEN